MSKDFEALMAGRDHPPPPTPQDRLSGDEWDQAYELENSITAVDKMDLRTELFAQMKLLKALRKHLFHPSGNPYTDTEFKDIRAYMASSIQLLSMLQKLDDALSTDEDFRKVESAIEMAMEDCPCPDFVAALKTYLSEGTSVPIYLEGPEEGEEKAKEQEEFNVNAGYGEDYDLLESEE